MGAPGGADGGAAADRAGPWWRRRAVLVAGALVVLLVAAYPLVTWVHGRWLDALLTFRESGRRATVRVHDGCLHFWRDAPPRSSDVTVDYCGWRKPEGVAEWVPETREVLVLDRSGTRVVELVAFGMLPAGAASVRYTLPGGEVVETEARQRAGLDGPAFWVHLRGVAIPVDLTEVGGEPVFARFQVFDRAGDEIPVV